MRRLGVLLGTVVAAVALLAQSASANSGTLSVTDVGEGSMTATATISVDDCGELGICGWYAIAYERHASLACAADKVIPQVLTGFETTPGTVTISETFAPFFPREAKLCLYIYAVAAAPQLASELPYQVPGGYGHQRSTGYNCSSFANQAQAGYYKRLYPGDPSGLDGDRDGTPCEDNPCPCGSEPIPPEPEPPLPVAPAPTPPPSPPSSPPAIETPSGLPPLCRDAKQELHRAVKEAKRRKRRWLRSRHTRRARHQRKLWREAVRDRHDAQHNQRYWCE